MLQHNFKLSLISYVNTAELIASADRGIIACLHLSSPSTLGIQLTQLCTISDQAFPITAARTWNSLLSEVTWSQTLSSFKSKLMTYLFLSFPGL